MKRIKNTFSKSFFQASAVVALFVLSLMLVPTNNNQTAHASVQDDLNALQGQLNETNKNIEAKKSEATSLTNEVAIFDGQIRQTELQIQQTETEIKLTAEKITKTEEDLKVKKETLNEYLRVIYEESNTSPLELVASADSFSDFVDRSEYLQTMQIKIKDMVVKIKQMKEELEGKKKNLNKLSDQLTSQKTDLNDKRTGKQSLLNQTKGEEANFQALAKTIRAQYDNMQASLWRNTGNYVSLGHVNKGDIIGYQGNSGFSSGSHLHFEIRNAEQQHVNPNSYIGNGYFIAPMSGASVTQGYGPTDWWAYSFHTGIDYSAGSGAPVVATASGDIVKRVSGQGNTYPGGPLTYGNHVIIKHDNGMFSLYGHLQ